MADENREGREKERIFVRGGGGRLLVGDSYPLLLAFPFFSRLI